MAQKNLEMLDLLDDQPTGRSHTHPLVVGTNRTDDLKWKGKQMTLSPPPRLALFQLLMLS